jgi:aminoglycoside phosphotransferase (APT) family kinase protein
MTPAWTAERIVSPELAKALIEDQFPNLAPAKIEPFGVGWDNTAYLVNGEYVFRFPRRQFAIPLIENGIRLAAQLAPHLPLPISAPIFVGQPTETFAWPFSGYRLIPGRTACAAQLSEPARMALAAPLGRFLAALHAIDPRSLHIGPDTLARLDLASRIAKARDSLSHLAARGLITDVAYFAAQLDAAPAGYQPHANTVVHGDFYALHLIVDEANRLTGVIDWDDAHLSDPAADLMIAHSFLPPSAHAAFREAYGPIDPTTWQVARLRALWHTLLLLPYAHDSGDANLWREAQTSLVHLRAM